MPVNKRLVMSDAVKSNRCLPMTFYLSGVKSMSDQMVTLLINPASKSETFAKIKSEHRVRGGYIIQHWGDDLRRISMNGSTSGFYSKNGLTRFDATNTDSYKEFMRFFAIFLNNGLNFIVDYGQTLISTIGRVNIMYDSQKYTGSFDSFKITEDANNPFLFRFNFDFIVTRYEQAVGSVKYKSF